MVRVVSVNVTDGGRNGVTGIRQRDGWWLQWRELYPSM